MNLQFSTRELRDLLLAWLALGVAFTVFLERDLVRALQQAPGTIDPGVAVTLLLMSLGTAGMGFLLHELAHKVVAIRFGQDAAFRADYGMLLLAILGGLIGFLFAAPGAVVHRGRISARERGLIALAGPLTNLVLAGLFLGALLALDPAGQSLLAAVGSRGFLINLLLAGFNMIPFGPLDGATVLAWNKIVFAITFLVTAGPALAIVLGVFP